MRIYVDTSVFGGYFDEEFEKWSKIIVNQFQNQNHRCVISEITEDELSRAPEFIGMIIDQIPEKNLEIIPISKEIEQLANQYIQQNVISEKWENDSLHVAAATVARVDVLVSWNFKHLVNLQRIRGYNAVNLLNNYQTLEIRNPKEIDYE